MRILRGWLAPKIKAIASDSIQDEFHASDFRLLCLVPVGGQLSCYRLISKRRWGTDYHLVLWPLSPSINAPKTHKLTIREIKHVGEPKYKTLTYYVDLIGKDFEWGSPHAMAIATINRLALFMANLSADSVQETEWKMALEICIAEVLGKSHRPW